MKHAYLSLIILSIFASACSSWGSRHPSNRPRTVEEAATRVIYSMTEEGKATVRSKTREELAELNDTWGIWIRNEIGLNDKGKSRNMPLMVSCGSLLPRECSMIIVERVWNRLREEHAEKKT